MLRCSDEKKSTQIKGLATCHFRLPPEHAFTMIDHHLNFLVQGDNELRHTTNRYSFAGSIRNSWSIAKHASIPRRRISKYYKDLKSNNGTFGEGRRSAWRTHSKPTPPPTIRLVNAREGLHTVDKHADPLWEYAVECIICHFLEGHNVKRSCAGTATNPLTIRSSLLNTYPNILSPPIRTECRSMTPCNSNVDEHMSAREIKYQSKRHWLGRQESWKLIFK